MDWYELSFSAAGDCAEALYAVLSDVAPGGCSIEEPVVILGPEEGVRPDPSRDTRICIYLPDDSHLAARRGAALQAAAGLDFPIGIAERPVREEDWANGWKEFFQVEHIGRRIVIRPTWRDYPATDGDVVLDLDPGMAFGTGQHETTRLCLVALEQLSLTGMDVLDLGCGSGILSVAAARLGAGRVTALDLESVAVEAAAANVLRNGVEAVVRVAEGSLGPAWPFEDPPNEIFDVVVANIHAAALVALAGAIFVSLRPSGTLVGSGVIIERLAEVMAALERAGFASVTVRADGEWRSVIARRPAAPA